MKCVVRLTVTAPGEVNVLTAEISRQNSSANMSVKRDST